MLLTWALKRLKLSSLTDWHKNPRQLTQTQYEQLQTSLEKFGLIEKPIVNADSAHTVIGGHQRLRILRDSGLDEIECWVPSRELSQREIEEANVRLNKATGDWDWDVLANEFEVDDLLDWGFSEVELQIDDWLGGDDSDDSGGDNGGRKGRDDEQPQQWLVLVDCEGEAQQAEVIELLTFRDYQCRSVTSPPRRRHH